MRSVKMWWSNAQLVLSDTKEDWVDTNSICEFVSWQWSKLRTGVKQGIWPWTDGP